MPTLDALWRDLRYAGRMARKNPGFTAAVAMTLALGIGANTALFSICNAVLLKPLPYSDPEHIVMLWEQLPGNPFVPVAPANFTDWRAQSVAFSEVAAINPFPSFILSGAGESVRLRGAAISWNFFSLLGTQITMGRSFLPEEDQPGRNRVAILPYSIWANRFGASPDIIGKSVTLNDLNFTVVGILPRDFEFVGKASDFQARNEFDIWVPLALNQNPSRGTHPLRVFARLKMGTTLSQAQANLNMVAANLARAFPEDNKDRGIGAVPLVQQITADVRPALLTLLGAVGFVLLIACANVANLLLTRGAMRQNEMAVRAAMGASRREVAQQLLVESLLLALAGGFIGLLLAVAAVRVVVPFLPADLARAGGVAVDLRVMVFTVSITLAAGILFGLAPLFQTRYVNANDALKQGTRIAGSLQTRLRSGLVIGQMAITLVLLIGGGLLAKSFWTLLHVPPGFRTDHLLTARLTLARSRYPDAARIANVQRDLIEQLRGVPGVRFAGLAAYLPLSGDDNGWAFFIQGRPPLPKGVYDVAKYRPVSHGYFETIGMPMIRGRDFIAADTQDAPFVVVINESMARVYWGQQDPVGQRLRFGNETWRTVIGVVGDVRHESLDRDLKPEMYVPFAQAPQPESISTIVVRTAGEAPAFTTGLRAAVSAIDPALPLDQVRTMEQIVWSSVGEPGFRTIVLGVFATLALAMASIGIYGVTNYSVTQRTREFGVYIAIGATTRDVLRLVLGKAALMIIAGLALGLLASVGLTRLIARFLYGVTALDPLTFVMVPLFLFAVAFLASYLPARRATKVDPMVALRYE